MFHVNLPGCMMIRGHDSMSLQVSDGQVSLCLDGLLQGADIDPAESTARFLELCTLGFRFEIWRLHRSSQDPRRLTCTLKKGLFQEKIHLPTILIFRGHLSFPGSIALLFPLVTFGNTYDVECSGDVGGSGLTKSGSFTT